MNRVEPDTAVAAMTRLWRSFGNEVSTPLLSTWRLMCDALNGANHNSVGWSALAMPTGIGKTQFTALYCALLENPQLTLSNLRSIAPHPGVLFVTRFTTEADRFVEQVNKFAGRHVAAAYHNKSSTSLTDATRFPVLAISHVACERHQMGHAAAGETREDTIWDHLIGWHQSRRAKIIIDETPNFVVSTQINATALAHLASLKWLPGARERTYFELEVVLDLLSGLPHRDQTVDPGTYEALKSVPTACIRDQLARLDNYALALSSDHDGASLRKICQATLSGIEAIQANRWAWVSFRGDIAQLNSASLHPSLRDGSGVILDGTAALYPGYSLLTPPANVIRAPYEVRSYDNVTLHLARGHNCGKEYWTKHAEQLWPKFRAAVQAAIPNAERVLIVGHKDFRQTVDVAPQRPFTFAHYGEIDGRNDWDAYEAIVLLGLPYRERAIPANIAQALLGPQSNAWLQSAANRQTSTKDDILTSLQLGDLSVSIVQAINRVRCRKPIDALGRCKPTAVFLILPRGTDGDAVLSAIVTSMPGINVTNWNVDAATRKRRAIPTTEALADFFTTAEAAVYTKADVRKATGIAPASLDRAIKRLHNETSTERKLLDEMRITYYPQRGQGAASYFVKS